MNIKELQRKVNEGLSKEGKPLVDDEGIIVAASSLEAKGLVKKVGDDLVLNNIT